ncbi:SMI1/KNR4 family protein [Streptomyces virginiae]|uniref:SMI1/KNR4 family protein n=1 Tax=Streptomyces virginiae TaxID=1961 RepID=UPI003243EB32
MHPAVEALVQLVPPQQEAAPRDWSAVHSRLGHDLPEDYRQLVDTYGGGLFDEVIWILEPDCEDKEYDLFAMIQERAEVLERLWEKGRGEPKPAQLAEPASSLVPFAHIEGTGAFLYWLTQEGQDPAAWTVMADAGRGPEWEYYPVSCVRFVKAALTGEIRSNMFDEMLPTDNHTFEPTRGFL